MAQRIRTFIAVEIDPAIRKATAALIEKLRPAGPDVKWVSPENLHLTVKFLGELDADDVAPVCAAVEKSVAETSPFTLEIRGAGAFPNLRRPQTIWVGAGQGDEQMADLVEHVEKALRPFGFRRESRRYRTHLTIGRVRSNARLGPDFPRVLGELADFQAGQMPVEELVIFSSNLQRGGPIYEAMGRAPLGGD